MADDGRASLSLILFLGSVFSPRYARARDRARAPEAQPPALDFPAVNLALAAPGASRWVMTELRPPDVERTAAHLKLGQTVARASGDSFSVEIDERTAPLGQRVRGRVTVRPTPGFRPSGLVLDPSGAHRWLCRSPRAEVEVELDEPRLRFSGVGYLDENDGDRALERDFAGWHWSRVDHGHHGASVCWSVSARDRAPRAVAITWRPGATVEADAEADAVPGLAEWRVARSGWGLPRRVFSDPDRPPELLTTLTDAPFYVRSSIRTKIGGLEGRGIHESLSLDRFRAGWVQALLPFRMRGGRE